jgi:hypothetical protein
VGGNAKVMSDGSKVEFDIHSSVEKHSQPSSSNNKKGSNDVSGRGGGKRKELNIDQLVYLIIYFVK